MRDQEEVQAIRFTLYVPRDVVAGVQAVREEQEAMGNKPTRNAVYVALLRRALGSLGVVVRK